MMSVLTVNEDSFCVDQKNIDSLCKIERNDIDRQKEISLASIQILLLSFVISFFNKNNSYSNSP